MNCFCLRMIYAKLGQELPGLEYFIQYVLLFHSSAIWKKHLLLFLSNTCKIDYDMLCEKTILYVYIFLLFFCWFTSDICSCGNVIIDGEGLLNSGLRSPPNAFRTRSDLYRATVVCETGPLFYSLPQRAVPI